MSEPKLIEEAVLADSQQVLDGSPDLSASFYYEQLQRTTDALGSALAFIRQVAALNPSLGPMDIQTLVADARALAVVPVETQEAAAPDDYTRPGWHFFPLF